MSIRLLGAGLLAAAALVTAGCGLCHKCGKTTVTNAPPCCPPPAAAPCCPPGGTIPSPPPGYSSGYAPPIVNIPVR